MKRVVVVEDNASVAKYFRYLLEHHHAYSVVLTESGDETLSLTRSKDTVAALVDVSLRATQYRGRYVDGIELARAIKDDPESAHVAVIVATAHVMAGDRERFLRESGADGFLRKPLVDPQDLLGLIAALTTRPPNDGRD